VKKCKKPGYRPGFLLGIAEVQKFHIVASFPLQIYSGIYGAEPYFPLALGYVTPGQSTPFTIKFKVPQGVSHFTTQFAGSVEDACGDSYTYGG
jgi:hypothetical protein